MGIRFAQHGPWLLALALLVACGGAVKAPVGERGARATTNTGVHVVHPGESLYSIAWRYDLDYQDLARWNAIHPPYTIQPGQRLRTRPVAATARPAPAPERKPAPAPGPSRPSVAAPPKAARAEPPSRQKTDATSKTASTSGTKLVWRWPAEGPVLRRFDPASPGKKGIAIGGKEGAAVRAAGPGRVVYAGSGLVGYGRLIIIKHNNTFLSAYGHNRKLLVREGDEVRSGQTIAYMGHSGTSRTLLHFEIRRNGKPVDPLRYLPRRRR